MVRGIRMLSALKTIRIVESRRQKRKEETMLVCWSGGCDSTLMLHNLLVERKQKLDLKDKNEWSESIEEITTISFIHPQVGARPEQARARERIAGWLHGKGMKFDRQEITITHSRSASVLPGESGLEQPQIWLSASSYLAKDENLYMGYVASDCVWHYKTEVFAAFNTVQLLAGKTGKLTTPFEWCKKTDVLAELGKIDLLDLCWWCEKPDGTFPHSEQCGKCGPCKVNAYHRWLINQS